MFEQKSAFKIGGMFQGASPLIFARAKDLRKNMTHSEAILWGYLKAGIEGLKFRRQHPISLYIADFYCHRAKLIIELDGSVHDDESVRENDLIRQKNLEDLGFKVVRFSNEQVLKQTELVIEKIKQTINLKEVF